MAQQHPTARIDETDPAESVAELVAAARSVPGVRDAGVVLRRRLRAGGGARGPAAEPSPVPVPAAEPSPVPAAAAEPSPVPVTASASSGREAVACGGPLQLPPDYPTTLVAALARAAERAPERGTTYLRSDGTADRQTYADLLADAERVLGGLREMGLRPGDPALFQLDDNRQIVTSFWACVLGGFIPTPVGVAPSYARDNAVLRKLRAAWLLLGRPVIVTGRALATDLAALAPLWEGQAPRTAVFELLASAERDSNWFPARPEDPAVHLLTSGSTGVPKCVRHPNRTLVARTWATCATNGFDTDDVSLNWMPLDHVGGIIMYNVRDVFLMCEHVNARTEAFIARPVTWLDWIDRYRATNTWAPNFAFSLVNECAQEIAAGQWDLSSMRNICNAGEAVVARTAHRFLGLLDRHELPGSAMRPCWGMSETSSGVTYARLDRRDENMSTVAVDKRSLGGALRFTASQDSDLVTLTEVGSPIAGVSLRITDARDRILPECHVGRLQVSGHTILDCYFANSVANAEAFTADGWFNTGDLAFLRDGALTLTGREKDLIIVNGANYITSDLESVAEQVPGVQVTYVAACGVSDPDHGTDRVVIFFVPAAGHPDPDGAAAGIATALAADVGLSPDLVIPVTMAEFPKTASGKIQRSELVAALQAGAFAGRAVAGRGIAGGGAGGSALAAGDEVDPPQARMFEKVWRASAPIARGPLPDGAYLLLVSGTAAGDELARELRARLPAGAELRVARAGQTAARSPAADSPAADSPGSYFDPDDEAAYDRQLDEAGPALVAVLHALGHGSAAAPTTAAEFTAGITAGPVSVLRCAQAIARRGLGGVELLVAVTDAVWTRAGERVDPRRAALVGLVQTAAVEGVARQVRLLDLMPEPAIAAAAIVDELSCPVTDPASEAVIASRDGVRLVQRLRIVEDPADQVLPDGLRPGGLYLITGGLGGIGFELAQHLLAAYGVRLLVIGRSPLAEGSGELAERLAELRDLGDAQYVACDVADSDALTAAIADAEAASGRRLDGVLHLAGRSVAAYWDDPAAHTVDRESADELRAMLHPKLTGAWTLGRVLDDHPDALLVLFSSVNGLFGGRSFGAYAAANSALDGFADDWAHGRGRGVRCIAWSIWTDVGMSRDAPQATVGLHGFRSIEVAQGLRAFIDALGQSRPYLVVGLDGANPHVQRLLDDDQLGPADVVLAVSPADGDSSYPALAQDVQDELHVRGLSARVLVVAEVPRSGDGRVDEQRLVDLTASPAVTPSRYVEPRSEMEREIATIWCDVLDIRRVGREDNFFALGGNSLRVMRAMARVNDLLGAAHPARMLYDNPTPGAFADIVTLPAGRSAAGVPGQLPD